MANDRYNQFLYTKEPMLTMLTASMIVGTTGAVASFGGKNVQSIVRLVQGVYQVKFSQGFPAIVSYDSHVYGGPTGSTVAAGAFATGTLYQITTLGTTTQAQWVAAGVDPDYTAVVGTPFVATSAGVGSGTVTAIGSSGIQQVEVARVATSMLANLTPSLKRGGLTSGASLIFRTIGATSSSVTTPIAIDPASGSAIGLKVWFRNSSIANY
jgi:hypothetical protein